MSGYTYDVYGEPTVTGTLSNEFDFAGQQTDGTTGLQYLRARYYDPGTGVFLSREPLALRPGWTANPYSYSSATPIRLTDPTGLRLVDTEGGGSGASPNACPTPSGICPSGYNYCPTLPGGMAQGLHCPEYDGGLPIIDLLTGACDDECLFLILGEYEGFRFGNKVNRRHAEQLRKQGWTSREITQVLLDWDEQYYQTKKPGLTAWVRYLDNGTANVIVTDGRGVIQGSYRSATDDVLRQLADEFGWFGFP